MQRNVIEMTLFHQSDRHAYLCIQVMPHFTGLIRTDALATYQQSFGRFYRHHTAAANVDTGTGKAAAEG